MELGMLLGTGVWIFAEGFGAGPLTRHAVRTRHQIDLKTGETVLQHGLIFKLLGFFASLVVPVLVLLTALIHCPVLGAPPKNAQDIELTVGIAVLFALLGSANLAKAYRSKVIISHAGLRSRFIWRKGERTIAWKEVAWVSFGRNEKSFLIFNKTGKWIRVSSYLSGISTLVRAIKENVPPDKCQLALDIFGRVVGKELAAKCLEE